ncbi:MAG TPA: hypothetical protein VD836_04560 [Solirubrobacteraceae bacterium]|nr:hypothetical protein [Solirubrobacteraceae bacterium]
MDSSVNALLIADLAQRRIAEATGARRVRETRGARSTTPERRGMSRLLFRRPAPVARPAGTMTVPRV